MNFAGVQVRFDWKPLLIASAILVVYASVILNLVKQWWNDENYSHGLIVPFVVGFIIWQEFDRLRSLSLRPELRIGLIVVISGLVMLLIGTLGSELLTQRVSLIVTLAGTVVYFFGRRLLFTLAVPFVLLLLAIPIPQIIFNKIAFPLQLLATRAANASLLLFGVSSERSGNVIELITISGSKVALEVVEACSGIRSLMTLVTLGLVYAYFIREPHSTINRKYRDVFTDPNFWRTVILMLAMVPIALVTNATRVFLTGIGTYYYGQQFVESWWHDAFGWLLFGVAFILLIAVNWVLPKIEFLNGADVEVSKSEHPPFSDIRPSAHQWRIAAFLITLVTAGLVISWFEHRTPATAERLPFSKFPARVANAVRMGADAKFDADTEKVLGASDYIMRNYIAPPRKFNLYIGYYKEQRTGATYHSPQNCLPGSGWVMSDGRDVQISTPGGASFNANQYVVQRGDDDRQIMIYWYQGRGRAVASEYKDKMYTIVDSITTGRSDGSMIRVITPVYSDETDSEAAEAAKEFAASIYAAVTPFVPE